MWRAWQSQFAECLQEHEEETPGGIPGNESCGKPPFDGVLRPCGLVIESTRIPGTIPSMTEDVIDNWFALARYDLATAEAMLQTRRFLYVGFMCQQAVEKLLKACYVKAHDSTPPYTHNLLRLIAELPWGREVDVHRLKTIQSLNSYYIESRYTEDIQELAATLTEAKVTQVLRDTKELFEWIKSKL